MDNVDILPTFITHRGGAFALAGLLCETLLLEPVAAYGHRTLILVRSLAGGCLTPAIGLFGIRR